MRSDWTALSLLAGMVLIGTGAAPVQGVREADRFQREADIARAGGQWDIAYPRYMRMVELFPETPHSRLGAVRAQEMGKAALKPNRSPASESPASWVEEIVDFLTWP